MLGLAVTITKEDLQIEELEKQIKNQQVEIIKLQLELKNLRSKSSFKCQHNDDQTFKNTLKILE